MLGWGMSCTNRCESSGRTYGTACLVTCQSGLHGDCMSLGDKANRRKGQCEKEYKTCKEACKRGMTKTVYFRKSFEINLL
jgi:hypothetical protein